MNSEILLIESLKLILERSRHLTLENIRAIWRSIKGEELSNPQDMLDAVKTMRAIYDAPDSCFVIYDKDEAEQLLQVVTKLLAHIKDQDERISTLKERLDRAKR